MIKPNRDNNKLKLSVRFMSHNLVRITDITVPNICAKAFS
jgi:hypothetical protein